jgi:hypothetical protein
MSLVNVFWPETDRELETIVALLEAHEVPCFVDSRDAGPRLSGMQVRARKPRTVMVAAERAVEALDLIRHLRHSAEVSRTDGWSSRTTRLRALIERVLLGSFLERRAAHVISNEQPHR